MENNIEKTDPVKNVYMLNDNRRLIRTVILKSRETLTARVFVKNKRLTSVKVTYH